MSRTCDGCGETFDTLTSYRLHDCPEQRKEDPDPKSGRSTREKRENRARRDVSAELTNALERAGTGDADAVYRLLGEYEGHLAEAATAPDDDLYWRIRKGLYEPVVDTVENVVAAEGWPYLVEILDAYWPDVTFDLETYSEESPDSPERSEWDDYPFVSHVLVGATGRRAIKTRLESGVAAIPGDALEYLFLFHRFPGGSGPWIDSMTYGWGIGHPDHPFEGNVHALVDGDYDIWAGGAVEHAILADQHAATSLLEDLLDAGIVDGWAMLLQGLGSLDRGWYPDEPRYWDWEAVYPELEGGFEWDAGVRDRLRILVEESGFDRQLPEGWTLGDIEV